jgi:two-component system sensor histidine kinase ArlS
MPIRLRIALIYSALVFFILSLVCGTIYYFSYQARVTTNKTRLLNRAITTASLLSQQELFDQNLIRRIDSSTTIALKDKAVQAYDTLYRRIYRYSDKAGDTLSLSGADLDELKESGSTYFKLGDKEAVGYYYRGHSAHILIFVAGEDVDGNNSLKGLIRILLISFLVGNFFVLISGYFFSAGLMLPVRRISNDVAEISAQNLARRIVTGKSKDEWYQLAETLNSLLNRLQDSFEMQGRFISNASHELSTPLTAISSQLEVTLSRPREATEYRLVMESIYQDVQNMTKLTQTLLEFAKASGSSQGLEIDLVRIDEIILNLPSEAARVHPSYSVKLQFDNLPEEEAHLLIFGNETLLLTAINNIVTNACKYSPSRQAVVSLGVSDHQLSVQVSDNGPGMEPEELERIFQPFYRADGQSAVPGFGLGLSLAQRIIKIHKGHITVQSRPGRGTTFTILLPSARSLGGIGTPATG